MASFTLAAFALFIGGWEASDNATGAGAGASAGAAPHLQPFELKRNLSGRGFRVGAYHVAAKHDRMGDPRLSLRAAIRALGEPIECENTSDSSSRAFVSWVLKGQRLRSQFLTRSSKPEFGAKPCDTNRRRMFLVSLYTFEGNRWHTPRGLKLDDSRAEFLRLYPEARNLGFGHYAVGTVPASDDEDVGALDVQIGDGDIVSTITFIIAGA